MSSTTGVRGLGGNGECERQDEGACDHTHQPSKVGHASEAYREAAIGANTPVSTQETIGASLDLRSSLAVSSV
jgi:hypothetical protein